MPRAWNLAGALALTALCFAPTTVRSSEPGSNPKPTDLESLEKRLNAQFETLNRKIDTASNQLASINDSVATLKRDVTSLERRLQEVERSSVPASEVQVLRDQIDRLREDLSSVRRSESQLRESLKVGPGTIPAPASPIPGGQPNTAQRTDQSTLRVNNDYPYSREVVVNSAPYVVPPLSYVDISVPVGRISYYVVGDPVGVRTRTVLINRIHPIRIFPLY